MSSSLPMAHPEWNDLLQKRDALQSQVAAVIADLHSLDDSRTVVLGRYAAAFGERLKNLHSLEIEAARLKREIELVQAAFNSGRDLDYSKIQETLDAEFAEWQAKLDSEALDLAKRDPRPPDGRRKIPRRPPRIQGMARRLAARRRQGVSAGCVSVLQLANEQLCSGAL